MKDGRFEVGDRIKGTPESNEHYEITNTDMLEGLVTTANTRLMTVSIVEHKHRSEVGKNYETDNNANYFELIEEKEKEEEDFWENLEVL